MSTCHYFCCNQPRGEESLAQMEAYWYIYQSDKSIRTPLCYCIGGMLNLPKQQSQF